MQAPSKTVQLQDITCPVQKILLKGMQIPKYI